MANKFWPATELTGGANSLAAIATADVANGDAAFVVREGIVSFYRMDTSYGLADNPPDVISPTDVGSNTHRWIKLGAIGTEPVGFQPTDISGCYGWFDFSDSTTLTIVDDAGTDKISNVDDKSGAGVIACHTPWGETVARRPLYIASGINSMGCIGWPDSDQQYRIDIGPATEDVASTDTGFSLFYVVKPLGTPRANSSSGYTSILMECGGGYLNALEMLTAFASGTSEYNLDMDFNEADKNITSSNITISGSALLVSLHGEDGVGFSAYEGGALAGTAADALYSMPSLVHVLQLGSGKAAGSNARNVQIGEVVVFNTNLADADREKIEGYLAHKWGTADDLPSFHPYKDAAP